MIDENANHEWIVLFTLLFLAQNIKFENKYRSSHYLLDVNWAITICLLFNISHTIYNMLNIIKQGSNLIFTKLICQSWPPNVQTGARSAIGHGQICSSLQKRATINSRPGKPSYLFRTTVLHLADFDSSDKLLESNWSKLCLSNKRRFPCDYRLCFESLDNFEAISHSC
jgi:hypothetical protein